MKQRKHRRNTRLLIFFVTIAAIYCLLLYFNMPLTMNIKVDGIIGVLYGLFIASHPAANVLDLLFYARDELRQGLSNRAYTLWWGLNGLVLVAGWFTIVFALMRFTSR